LNLINTIVLLVVMSYAPSNKLDFEAYDYIEDHKEMAIIEMYRTGVPASITIAQALHETNYGKSPLAVKANNHFGIKCKTYWSGLTYYHKDDDLNDQGKLIDSCFRAYGSVHDSYIDHSNFLKHTAHYQHLFNLGSKDYESWAKGLKSSGYATDPHYADKLIRYIVKYDLHALDLSENPYNKLRKIKTISSNG